MKIYSIGSGLKDISVSANSSKNNLPVGTILKMNGYSDPEYVIIKNMGISDGWEHYGARYEAINLNDYTPRRFQAYELMFLSEKQDNRIQTYITEKQISSDEVLDAINQSKVKAEYLESEKIRKAEKRLKDKEELLKKYPYLIQTNNSECSRVTAAKNIRIELKKAFPKIKFSVTSKSYSGGNSIDVYWTNGPSVEQVEKITQKYQGGSFNGMEDIYEYSHDVFNELFGDAKYVMESRNISDDIREKVAKEYVELFGEVYIGMNYHYEKSGEFGYALSHKALSKCDLTSGYKGLEVKNGSIIAISAEAK